VQIAGSRDPSGLVPIIGDQPDLPGRSEPARGLLSNPSAMADDVAVIGGGPAGAAVARLLARAGRSVVLVDACRRQQVTLAERIPASAAGILAELDLLDTVVTGPHIPAEPDGWHVDRARFDGDLVHLAVHAGATLVATTARDFDLTFDGWRIAVDETAIHARFIVDATGRRAVVATRHGARRLRVSSRCALVVTIENNGPDHDRRHIIEPIPGGVLTSAPLSGRRRVVALHADERFARSILQTPIELQLRIRASAEIGPLIHPRARLTNPVLFETGAGRLDRVVGHRWLAVGDAAVSCDPLTSDGIVRALESAVHAARAIDAALDDRPQALDEYASAA
jgi:flavin-dependent dehydrogenase